MDITTLTRVVVAFLTPLLPYLLSKESDEAAEAAMEEFGKATWTEAKAFWARLRGKRSIEEAAEDLVEMYDDPDARAAFRLQLKKVLAQEEELGNELLSMMSEIDAIESGILLHAEMTGSGAIAQGPGAVAAGERGVAIGGSVGGSAIVTGDLNVIGEMAEDEVKD